MSVSEQLILDISRVLNSRDIFTIDCQLELPNNVLPYADAAFIGAVSVVGEYNAYGDDVEVICDLSFTISALCDRCGVVSQHDFVVELDELFTDKPTDDSYCYNGYKLNLTQAIIDNILSHLPSAFICSEQCKGLCPHCGTNFNISSCDCN